MEFEAVLLSLGIGLFGAFMVTLGLYLLFGPVIIWYVLKVPFVTISHYALIPGGIFFLLFCVGFYLPDKGAGFVLYLGFLIAIVGTILMRTIPRLKPKWLQWLYNEHGEILDALRYEIRQDPYWNNKINTQAELEAWVEEVRERRGL